MKTACLILTLITLLSPIVSETSTEINRCTASLKCPSHQPCCSELGFCSNSEIGCSLGCNPAYSFGPDSCKSKDSCLDKVYKFTGSNESEKPKVFELAAYKVMDSKPVPFDKVDFFTDGNTMLNDEGLTLKMIKGSKGGSRVVSTNYLLYGTIIAKLKTGRTGGVTMSEVKDEIDFEWVGSNVNEVQTNIFYRSKTDYIYGGKHKVNSDTSQKSHEYKIEWTPDNIKWYVDGELVRTLTKEQTKKNSEYNFPSTPSRIEFGLWNGGSNAEGTKLWAGGEVNWDSEDIQKLGYFKATIETLEIKCDSKFKSWGNSTKSNSNNDLTKDKSSTSVSKSITSTKISWVVLSLGLLVGLTSFSI